jgi:hypothetical protein
MSGEHELREVPVDSGAGAGEQLQESAFTDTMAAAGGVGGLAGLGSLYYSRAQYLLARDNRDAEYEVLRAELEAQYEANRRALNIEYRMLYAQMNGLDALDRLDGFGLDDDYYGGFGVE